MKGVKTGMGESGNAQGFGKGTYQRRPENNGDEGLNIFAL
jgi:hypothetical protein